MPSETVAGSVYVVSPAFLAANGETIAPLGVPGWGGAALAPVAATVYARAKPALGRGTDTFAEEHVAGTVAFEVDRLAGEYRHALLAPLRGDLKEAEHFVREARKVAAGQAHDEDAAFLQDLRRRAAAALAAHQAWPEPAGARRVASLRRLAGAADAPLVQHPVVQEALARFQALQDERQADLAALEEAVASIERSIGKAVRAGERSISALEDRLRRAEASNASDHARELRDVAEGLRGLAARLDALADRATPAIPAQEPSS
jgi:hypothetical protein